MKLNVSRPPQEVRCIQRHAHILGACTGNIRGDHASHGGQQRRKYRKTMNHSSTIPSLNHSLRSKISNKFNVNRSRLITRIMPFRPERFLASGRSSTKYHIETQLFLAEIRFSLASSSSRQRTRNRTDFGHNETRLFGSICSSQIGIPQHIILLVEFRLIC